jgi:hypothetical protein
MSIGTAACAKHIDDLQLEGRLNSSQKLPDDALQAVQ